MPATLRSITLPEKLAQHILDQNPSPVLQLDASAEVLYANAAAAALLQAQQNTYGHHHSLCHQLLALAEESTAGVEQEIELTRRRYLLRIVPIGRQYTLYFTDITARYCTEQKHLAQRDFFETVLYHLPTGVAIFDLKHRFQYVNPSAVRNEETRQWIIGKTNSEYCTHFNHPRALAAQRREKFEQAVREGKEVAWEETFETATGLRHWMRFYRPVFGPDGQLHIMVGSSADITARYLAEQAMAQARQEAEATIKVREAFLANMSHEIRTPMNGVLGMAGLLARTGLSTQQQEYVSIIRNSGNHLLGVLNDVLDIAKITAGKLELEYAPFDLAYTVRTATQIQAFRAAEKNIAFELRLPEQPFPVVLGDSHRLSQVLLNLLSNAIKFTAQGHITLSYELYAETATTLTLSFRVTDTGLGVAPEKQEVIFENFTQAYADTTRNFGGTGLGLAISSRLVAQLGGHLVLCSEYGQGSTFGFTLPFPKADPATPLPQPSEALPEVSELVRGWRVLLVEDHDVNRQLAQLVLEQHGVVVDAAANGLEALELFWQTCYDVVLMDIQMPDMSGLDVTAAIRRHSDPLRAQTPIIALTANTFRSDNEKYLAAGLNECLAKPFDEAELLRKMVAVRKAAPATATPLFNLHNLYQVAHGSTTFVHRILTSFLTSTPLVISQLHLALDTTDWGTAAACAHKLKPTLKLLQVERLIQDSIALEDAATSPASRLTAIQRLLDTLPHLLAQLSQRAETLLAHGPPTQAD